MKALVGLGNPGAEYAETRHNLGFRVADRFTARHGGGRYRRLDNRLEAAVRAGDFEVRVVKPMTYMNRSGEAVRPLVEEGVHGGELMVAHDDLDLPLGVVRLKLGGGHGGHNGLRSILAVAAAGDFVRVRLGIRRSDPAVDAASWVLAPFPPEETAAVADMVEAGAAAIDLVVSRGLVRAMDEINRRPPAATA